ncbi:hypothetical protein F511_40089 [Dorcoceras hygrometricum]|uniref:Uncharacterized protein n=1 Tax=Dorcoceras hygrometricum TaxID=472368 RepID=A0A2Z7CEN9_9LAMI|nr:hypothetical protein F511_40089 [Dorcoceras hygrometricum]
MPSCLKLHAAPGPRGLFYGQLYHNTFEGISLCFMQDNDYSAIEQPATLLDLIKFLEDMSEEAKCPIRRAIRGFPITDPYLLSWEVQSQAFETNDWQSAANISLQPAGHPDASNFHPVASFAYPVDMESSRKKADVVESYNPDARYPVAVFEASAVAQSIQSTKKQLLREVL